MMTQLHVFVTAVMQGVPQNMCGCINKQVNHTQDFHGHSSDDGGAPLQYKLPVLQHRAFVLGLHRHCTGQ